MNTDNTENKIHHTGAEWLAVDHWVKAEREEKGVRGPKTIAAEAEAWTVYKAAREAESAPAKSLEAPVEALVEAHVEAPVEALAKKVKKSLTPPSKPLVRQTVALAPPSVKQSRLAMKGAEALAKIRSIKKADLTGLEDWVEPNADYSGSDDT